MTEALLVTHVSGGLRVERAPERTLISQELLERIARGGNSHLAVGSSVLTISATNGEFRYALQAPFDADPVEAVRLTGEPA